MRSFLIIAKNSVRETYRDRMFLVILIVSALVVALSFVLGQLTFDEQVRILFNMGLWAVHLVMLGIAIFMGSFSISRELERQTFVTILARPASRNDFLIGKFLGVLVTTVVSVISLGAFVWFILPKVSNLNYLVIVYGIILEGIILLSLSIFLSLVLRPVVSIFVTFGIFLIGQWLPDLQFFAEKSKATSYLQFSKLMNAILPNLYQLNWRTFHELEIGIPIEKILYASFHASVWCIFLLICSSYVFNRRSFL